jgi:ubiquinone/menaquinone biosynthesis C-methylase UbiE
MNICPDTKPVLYDGKKMPFKDNVFDAALLITVLHHTPDPESIVRGQ